MQAILIVIFLLVSIGKNFGQSTKVNNELFLLLNQSNINNDQIPLLIKGHPDSVKYHLTKQGDRFKYTVKDITAAEVTLKTVEMLLPYNWLERIEYRSAKLHQLNYPEDSAMLKNNNVHIVHEGGGNLPHPFKGTGVLLGAIDNGFDFNHPDFLNQDSSTRILSLWDQKSNNTTFFESFYGYGASWDNLEIDNHLCTQTPQNHGSHVLAIAGGNGSSSNKYQGIAPEADLIAVTIQENVSFLTSFVDAVHFIFRKADSLGMPCVINSSVGTYTSGHDANDLYSEIIDNMLTAGNGRALIQAAGNARQKKFHLRTELQNSYSNTAFSYVGNQSRTHFYLYADTADFNQIDFKLQLINPISYQLEAQSIQLNILDDFSFSASNASYSSFLFNDTFGLPVVLNVYADQYNGVYELYFSINSSYDLGYWNLYTTGTGKFDIWSSYQQTFTSNILSNLPLSNYKNPDNEQTIVGFWTCSDKVISVASYQNRSSMVNWAGDTIDLSVPSYPKLGISEFSSLGPTRTGLLKPDITAPGGRVMSAFKMDDVLLGRINNDNNLDQDGWHFVGKGTSMAAPMVAGAVALLMECNPNLSLTQLQQALRLSAVYDNFVLQQVFALPNIHWGYGKLDVYNLLQECLIFGCMDSSAINFNPLANVSDSSCYYVTSVETIDIINNIEIYPNPFNNELTLEQNYSDKYLNCRIINAQGITVLNRMIEKGISSMVFNTTDFVPGVYYLTLESEHAILVRKVLVKQ